MSAWPRVSLVPLPPWKGSMTAYLVEVDRVVVGRVIGERLNARNTLWTARDVTGKDVAATETRKEAVDRLVEATREETP